MADYDDKFLGPVFPTRHGTAQGGSTERQMLDSTQGAPGIRTKIRTNPDGSTTRLKTRGGHPHFYTDEEGAGASVEMRLPTGLSAAGFRANGDQFTDNLVFKPRVDGYGDFKIHTQNPPQMRISYTDNHYHIAFNDRGGFFADGVAWWAWGGYVYLSGKLWWKCFKKQSVSILSGESFIIPVKIDKDFRLLTDMGLRDKAGAVDIYASRPVRAVGAGYPKAYSALPPHVANDTRLAVVQSFDDQTFLDPAPAGGWVVTDRKLYIKSYLLDLEDKSISSEDTYELSAAPLNIVTVSEYSRTATQVFETYPTVLHRCWDRLWNENCDGDVCDIIMEVFDFPSYGTISDVLPFSYGGVQKFGENPQQQIGRVIVGNEVVPAYIKVGGAYEISTDVIQEKIGSSVSHWTVDRDGSRTFGGPIVRDTEVAGIHVTEKLDEYRVYAQVGDLSFDIFSARGVSTCDADKLNDEKQDVVGFTDPWVTLNMRPWNHLRATGSDVYFYNGDAAFGTGYAYNGQPSFQNLIESYTGYSRSEWESWVGGIAGADYAEVHTRNEETSYSSGVEFSCRGNTVLCCDAALNFVALLEFTVAYKFNRNSAVSDATNYKWIIPQIVESAQHDCTVSIVVIHNGIEHRKQLFADRVNTRPNSITKSYSNPYYFVWAHYGVSAMNAVSAAGADMVHRYGLPDFHPRPSWFGSITEILSHQGASKYISGFTPPELIENGNKFASHETSIITPSQEVIASRKFNARAIGADWMFRQWNIDMPITTDEGAPEELTSAYSRCPGLRKILIEDDISFEYDTRELRAWVGDLPVKINGETAPQEGDRYAYCFRV